MLVKTQAPDTNECLSFVLKPNAPGSDEKPPCPPMGVLKQMHMVELWVVITKQQLVADFFYSYEVFPGQKVVGC